jgi:hypothetical protein
MFSDGLYNFISTDPGVQAVVGTSRGDKTTGVFYMLGVKEPTLPYLTYQRVSGGPVLSLSGANAMHEARVRISCYGASQRSAAALAEVLKKLFATWTGTFNEGTVVMNVSNVMEADDMEPIPNGTIYSTHLDFMFQYLDVGA